MAALEGLEARKNLQKEDVPINKKAAPTPSKPAMKKMVIEEATRRLNSSAFSLPQVGRLAQLATGIPDREEWEDALEAMVVQCFAAPAARVEISGIWNHGDLRERPREPNRPLD